MITIWVGLVVVLGTWFGVWLVVGLMAWLWTWLVVRLSDNESVVAPP